MHILNDYFSGSSQRAWIWLFPITYLLHIAEEYLADFPAYLLRAWGIQLSQMRFLTLQTLGLLLMVLGIVLGRRLHFANQMLVVLAAVVIANSLVHVSRSILSGGYEPGLLTSLLVWLPLGTGTLYRLWGRVNRHRYFLAAATGVAIGAAVEMITMTRY